MQKQIIVLLTRWLANILGIWLAYKLGIVDVSGGYTSFALGAFILALLNAIIKPLIIVFTLPLIYLSLGFFLIIINGLVIYLLSLFYNSINLDTFLHAMLAGIIIGLVNYIITIVYERLDKGE